MDILSFILSLLAVAGYIISMISFVRQGKKEDANQVRERTEMHEDIKYLRKTVDEMNKSLQELTRQSNRHDSILAQHEIRIGALERWRESHNKE